MIKFLFSWFFVGQSLPSKIGITFIFYNLFHFVKSFFRIREVVLRIYHICSSFNIKSRTWILSLFLLLHNIFDRCYSVNPLIFLGWFDSLKWKHTQSIDSKYQKILIYWNPIVTNLLIYHNILLQFLQLLFYLTLLFNRNALFIEQLLKMSLYCTRILVNKLSVLFMIMRFEDKVMLYIKIK